MTKYYIASLKHTYDHHEHITFWGRNHSGYTHVIGETMGEYDEEQARKLNDGESHIAVPVEVVRRIAAESPLFRSFDGELRPLYDLIGPVVENTTDSWGVLKHFRLEGGGPMRRPEVRKRGRWATVNRKFG